MIRIIYDRYIHTDDGIRGVAKYLNDHGYTKKLRQNGLIPGFSSSFVKAILDHPVYKGKIAYGRRKVEKKIGTRNEMHIVTQSEFPVYDGLHEAIISEEDWELAHTKRSKNAYRREKIHDVDHAHVLSGILKCPCCGKGLYGNIAKAHSKDNKTRHYYYCKNTVSATGHPCTFCTNIEQTALNNHVASLISVMVSKPQFVEALKAKIGSSVDTAEQEKQLDVLRGQLRQVIGTKVRLEKQMDCLDVDDTFYDRKMLDLQRRYDEQYEKMGDLEIKIEESERRIQEIHQEKISGDNIYQMLLAFDRLYGKFTEAEQKEFMRSFVERIEIYPEKRPDGSWLRSITFNFPLPLAGGEVKELPLDNEMMLENVVLLSKPDTDKHITVDLNMSELDVTAAESKATYAQIKARVKEQTGLDVSNLYIAQVKAKCGIKERANYNHAKSADAKQPVCPMEKEKAIRGGAKILRDDLIVQIGQ